jgi:hypothetical protein
MLTSLQYKCVNKQTNKHAESESEVFSKSESADFIEVRGLGLGRPKALPKGVRFCQLDVQLKKLFIFCFYSINAPVPTLSPA